MLLLVSVEVLFTSLIQYLIIQALCGFNSKLGFNLAMFKILSNLLKEQKFEMSVFSLLYLFAMNYKKK